MITTERDNLTLRAIRHGLLPCWFLAELGKLVTARVVADQLDVCTGTVLRWTRQGKLPGFRLPSGALRYRESDLLNWIENRAIKEDQCQPPNEDK
jgi:Helix-turn-helix domain